MTTSPPHLMSCMEVWGGNQAADQGVIMPGLDLWVHSAPFEGHDQGGDLHYVSSCGTGRISRLVVADVSGHGAAVAEFARRLRLLMRRFVNYVDQSRFVEALNRGLLEGDTGLFATSVAMTFFAPSSQLDLCNAGHPRPLWYRAETGRWDVLASADRPAHEQPKGAAEPANLPLGVLEPTRYEQFGVKLGRNDLVLAYTDAAVEARRPDGTLLGEQGLLEVVSSLDAQRPEALLGGLLAALEAVRGGAPPDDDLTLLLLRHNGVGTQAPFLSRIWASLRFLGMLVRGLMPVGERPPIPWPEPSKVNLLGAVSRRVSQAWGGGAHSA